MFQKDKPFTYEIDPNFDHVIDEKGNKFTALRKIKWGDSPEFKLDLRNYIATEEGERMGKGCTFISENGANELVNVLLNEGYGNADEVANQIIAREDLTMAVCNRLIDNGIDVVEQSEKYLNSQDKLYNLYDESDILEEEMA